jgi:IS30 family transposase
MIREDWSPEQITGHLKDIGEPGVSPEWIYQHIYADKSNGGDLHTRLRCQKKRRKRYGSIERRGQIKNRVSIEKRPEIVDLRKSTSAMKPLGYIWVTKNPALASKYI